MQTLYYYSSSLILEKEDNSLDSWESVTSLILSSSINQWIAFSSSTELAYFPSDNTSVYYQPYFPIITTGSASLSTVDWFYDTNMPLYFYPIIISGSGYSIRDITGSVYHVSSSGPSNVGGFGLYQSHSYEIALFGSSSVSGAVQTLEYTSSIYINDINSGSTIYTTESYNVPISTSFSPQDFKYYQITMSVIYAGETYEDYLKYAEAVGLTP